MEQQHLDEFERRVAFFGRPALRRMIASPIRFTSSKLLEGACTRLGTCVRARGRTFWGATMTLPIPEQVSTFIHRYGFFEEGLTRIFLRLVRPGMTVFDVGGHFGYFTLLASDIVGKGGIVHTFEPTPSTFELLRSNTADRKNVHLHNLALWREETTVTLNDYGLRAAAYNSLRTDRLDDATLRRLSDSAARHDVRATTLDRHVEQSGARPDFIKLDAEGAELDILRGGERTLREIRPLLTLEVGDFRADDAGSSETVAYLAAHDYRPLELRDRRLVPHESQKHYVYDNLLFVPADRLGEFAGD